jgi:hypothetical protein
MKNIQIINIFSMYRWKNQTKIILKSISKSQNLKSDIGNPIGNQKNVYLTDILNQNRNQKI